MTGFKATNFTGNGNFPESPITGPAPFTVNFVSLTTAVPPANPTTWFWDFGDGGTSTLENPTYIYNVPGTYTVTLTPNNYFPEADGPNFVVVTASGPAVYSGISVQSTIIQNAII